MIKEELIGGSFKVIYNGTSFQGTITNDPSQFAFYRTIGLDVFKDRKTAKPNIKKAAKETKRTVLEKALTEKGITFRSNWKTETLQKKLDDFNKGNG